MGPSRMTADTRMRLVIGSSESSARHSPWSSTNTSQHTLLIPSNENASLHWRRLPTRSRNGIPLARKRGGSRRAAPVSTGVGQDRRLRRERFREAPGYPRRSSVHPCRTHRVLGPGPACSAGRGQRSLPANFAPASLVAVPLVQFPAVHVAGGDLTTVRRKVE